MSISEKPSIREVIRLRQLFGLRTFGISEDEYRSRKERLEADMRKSVTERMITTLGREPNAEELKQLEQFFGNESLPTDLQEPTSFRAYDMLLDDTLALAGRLGTWERDKPIIATELAGEINGYCFSDDHGDSAIVIDETLSTFCHLLAKVVALAAVSIDGAEIKFDFDKDRLTARLTEQDVHTRFLQLFTAYVEHGTTSSAEPYMLRPEYDGIVNVIRDSMKLFIVAHECGHLHHEHTSDRWMMSGNKTPDLTQMIDGKAPVYVYRHQKELQADGFALNIVLNSVRPDNAASNLAIVGPFLFFIGLDMLERFLFYYITGRNIWDDVEDAMGQVAAGFMVPSTHPKPMVRMRSMHDGLQRASGIPESIMRVVQFCQDLQLGFLHAEAMAQKMLEGVRSDKKVHRKWLVKKNQFASFGNIGSNLMERLETEAAKSDSADP